ncbi:MAG TPA: polysaccharide biosynthesis/export family protein [Pyrinomonadaceae bacterium]
MKARTLILLVAFCLGTSLVLNAQEPQGQTMGASQGAAVMPTSSSMDNQGIKRYILGPGDTLDIRIFGQPDLNWTGEVEADGNLTSLPFIETPIRAQCRTDKEVQKDVIAAYSKFLKNPQVSVRVTGRNSRTPATIFGAVPAPTRIQMFRRLRLNEAITLSGGYTERANGDIQVMHMERVMCPEPGEEDEPLITADGSPSVTAIKIYKISDLLAGKPESNPVIRPGDLVTVMESKPVYITGSVYAPQAILLREGLTLSKALAMVGGPNSEARASDVRIYRSKLGSADWETIKADYGAIRKKKQEDIVLQPYDIIEVPKTKDWSPGGILKLLSGVARGGVGSVISAPITRMVYY